MASHSHVLVYHGPLLIHLLGVHHGVNMQHSSTSDFFIQGTRKRSRRRHANDALVSFAAWCWVGRGLEREIRDPLRRVAGKIFVG